MSTKDKIEYWLDIAQYDLVSAKAMLESKRFLYGGFLCHQVAEKCLKAHYWHSLKKQRHRYCRRYRSTTRRLS